MRRLDGAAKRLGVAVCQCGTTVVKRAPNQRHCSATCARDEENRLRVTRKRQMREHIAAAEAAGDLAKAVRLRRQLWVM